MMMSDFDALTAACHIDRGFTNSATKPRRRLRVFVMATPPEQ
jgi:hypothetical protein